MSPRRAHRLRRVEITAAVVAATAFAAGLAATDDTERIDWTNGACFAITTVAVLIVSACMDARTLGSSWLTRAADRLLLDQPTSWTRETAQAYHPASRGDRR